MIRGRPRKRKYEEIDDIILKHRDSIILENDKICSKNDGIWKTISNNIGIPSSSLHTYVTCNRNHIREKLKNPDESNVPDSKVAEQSEDENFQVCIKQNIIVSNFLVSGFRF